MACVEMVTWSLILLLSLMCQRRKADVIFGLNDSISSYREMEFNYTKGFHISEGKE